MVHRKGELLLPIIERNIRIATYRHINRHAWLNDRESKDQQRGTIILVIIDLYLVITRQQQRDILVRYRETVTGIQLYSIDGILPLLDRHTIEAVKILDLAESGRLPIRITVCYTINKTAICMRHFVKGKAHYIIATQGHHRQAPPLAVKFHSGRAHRWRSCTYELRIDGRSEHNKQYQKCITKHCLTINPIILRRRYILKKNIVVYLQKLYITAR